ncbi:restriction endonuclease subunit S [Acinetobacter sp. YH16031]|uniref:restriction endonuclease subunit S n=1 Tax=Acinetobacter sp. YH16031 TaxID=2601180 RepID=UPI0015D13F6D|nr:restriction endonuclease subunit S [Acinetobacter sp. YH16031]
MVPNGWNKQTVGDLCDFINGNGFKSSEWSDKGLPIIRIQNLNGSNNFNYYEGAVLEKWIVNQGDILFAWAGSKGVSFGAKYWDGPKGLLNQHIFRVEPKAHVDKKWLFWVLLKVTQRVENMAHGFKATLLHVQKADITEQVILVPSLAEQQRIAQILSTWDQAISATEKMLENSQQQKKALMQQLLTGKKRLFDENGVKFSGEWQTLSLDSLFFFKKGKGLSKDSISETGQNKCILYGELYTKYSEVIDEIVSKTDSSEATLSMKGDILIPSSTTTSGIDLANATALLEDSILLGGDINILRPKGEISSEFMAYLLTHIKKYEIASRAQGITIIHLYGSDLKDIEVQIPVSVQEQKKIAKFLSIVEKEMNVLQGKIVCLKKEKKALMQQLLTGKKRVKVAA